MHKLIYSILLGAFLTVGVLSVQAAVSESSVEIVINGEKDKDGKKKKKKKKCCKKSNKACSPEEKKACEEKKSMEEKAE